MKTILFAAGALACLAAAFGAPTWAQERERERTVPEQVEHLETEAERLAESGHPDQAAALLEAAERLTEREHGEREEWGELDESDVYEAEAIPIRLRDMQAKIAELTELGRINEAEYVASEVRELKRALERDHGEYEYERESSSFDYEGNEIERRIHHFTAAIENLHEAGAHDQAEELENQLAEWEEHRQGPRGPEAHIEELTRAVQQLHAQVRELREVVAQLQERVAQFSE